MQLFPDFILLMSLLLFIVIYVLFKFLNNTPHYKEKKKELIEKFQDARALSIKLQETVSAYILTNNANEATFFDNVSYGGFLKSLQKNHIQNLSEKYYIKLKNSNNRLFLKKTSAMLDEQGIKLKEAQNKVLGLRDTNKKLV